MCVQVVSHNTSETQMLGEQVGHLLKAGDIVCLYGELGTGKTVLSQGIARGLEVAPDHAVRSPSFVLMRRYQGRIPVYHADLYRLEGPADIADIGLREFLGGDGVAIIEWADKLEASLPEERLDISIAYRTEDTRLITITPQGVRYHQFFEQWQRQPTSHGGTRATEGEAMKRASP